MKKTIYFTGDSVTFDHLETGIQTATRKRDAWLTANKDIIGKIDIEDIKITPWNANNSRVIATIQLTYYPK